MAKQAILDVLEKTIGKYVKNLDPESLNVAVWKGKIELHSLELDLDAINTELARQAAESPNLAIPFRVVDGAFGSLHVEVPWSRITSQSVVLRAKGLKVIVEPYDSTSSSDYVVNSEISEKNRIQKVRERRMQSLQSADEYRIQSNALRKLAEEESSSLPSGVKSLAAEQQASFTENLVRRIIENIQLDVEDVHISVKDAGSAAGVVLKSFSLVTTDTDGKRVFVDRKKDIDKFLYKAMQINGLGVYLDELSPFPKRKSSQEEEPLHSYILSPLSFDSKLRQAGTASCVDFPKYLVLSELQDMSIILSKSQLELGNKIALAISAHENAARPLFPEYRPLTGVNKDSAKEWWIYAFRCIGRLNGRRLWSEFLDAFRKRKTYITLYKRSAHCESCQWLQPLSEAENSRLDKIAEDREISIEGIMAWRNIADAQVELEKTKRDDADKKKKATGGIMAALFGSKETAYSDESSGDDDPPITLSIEEMQELEAITMKQTEGAELSKDSKLCDIKFILGAFRINLVRHAMKNLASFEMGTTTTTFNANVDGSYIFESKLASMELHDRVTLKSLFPTVMRNITSLAATDDMGSDVFKFSLEKSRAGDQHLMLRLAAFEMVASQMLLLGVKQFFTLSGASHTKKGAQQNAMLRQSMSGSVDLFYDADDGTEGVHIFDITEGTAAAKEKISDTLSSALVDAWKDKTKEKKKWTVDCDIHAPVLIIPESCSSPEANVLVFDFGRLKFDYGKGRVGPKVQSWFDEQSHFSKKESIIDPGSIDISNLTFTIGKAGDFYWRLSTITAYDVKEKMTRSTVIEPLSGSLNFGVLSDAGRDVPSVCAYGGVPVVGLSISPAQISKVLSVYAGWRDVISEFIVLESGQKKSADHEEEISEGVPILEQGTDEGSRSVEMLSRPSLIMQLNARRASMSSSLPSVRSPTKPKMAVDSAHGEFVTMYVSMALQRLSIRVLSQSGEGIEAHLVSVSASTSQKSDGSSLSRLRMGWFWLLDRFSYTLARKQRLIAHSTLPLSAAWFSKEGTYDILGTLRQRGVFDEEYSGSSELADITLNSRGSTASTILDDDPFSTDDPLVKAAVADSTLDAKFSSLYIHWNPQAVKIITQAFSQTIESLRDFAAKESLPKYPAASSAPAIFDESQTRTFEGTEGPGKRSTMMISAELKSFEILLQSAKDDEALYILTMADTSVQMLSSQCGDQSGMLVSLGLGDVRIATPETSRTNPAYKTLLGLAPDHSDSLLSVKYSMGAEAVQASDLKGVDPNKCDMCGEVTLSPMRLVYIHAQVLTLVDYINQGILGVLTSQAASPASDPTAEETLQEVGKEKFFVVKATGLDVIVPRSASNTDYLAVRAGELVVNYLGYSEPGGGEAHLSLSEVTLEDSENQRMVNTKLRMTIDVIMPPADIGTMDDRAMRVTINMFQVEFLLTQNQYQRIMWIMAENVGEADPCFRSSPDKLDLSLQDGLSFDSRSDDQTKNTADITHAGVKAVDVQNRMFVDFNMDVLSLELCGDDVSDPVVHFAALESSIAMKLLPDEDTMTVKASLQDLTCDDRRLKAMDRPFRSLMNQVKSDAHDETGKTRDIFCASYKKIGVSSTEVDLKLGSPRIVFIPDVVSQVLKFFKTEEKPDKGLTDMEVPKVLHAQNEAPQSDEKLVVEVQVDENEESVETAFVSLVQGRDSESVTKMSFTIKTANCSVVLIDMGSAAGSVPESHASFVAKSRSQLIETIVFQGQFDAQTSYTSEIQSGRLVSANSELHGECMEVYTAHGSNFAAPIQIVEPGSVSVFFTLKPVGENSKELDVRLVTLSPIDITFSMQNAALVNAITSSCIECFDTDETDHTGDVVVPLSEKEVSTIEALSSALENTERFHRDESSVAQSVGDQSSVSTRNDTERAVSIVTRVNVTMTETQVTIINDLQGLDEALFRVSASNFVAGGELSQGYVASTGSMKETTFYIQVNTALMADYFDPSLQLWVVLLKKPWEASLKCSREAGHRSSSERMSTIVDIEAYPCLLSFSEQFLVSLGAAIRMWSIYSMATTTAIEGDMKKKANTKEEVQGISKKALAATAARNLITSLPYAVENHSGLDIHVMLPCSGERRLCQNGTLQYFRFEPPQGRGSGGHRCYGQDVTRLKAMNLFVSGRIITIENIDAELSRPRHVHVLGEGRYLVSRASKEGKTKILHLSSPVDIHNCTSVPFSMSVSVDGKDNEFGVCAGHQGDASYLGSIGSELNFDVTDGNISKASKRFGIPLNLIAQEDSTTILHLSPRIAGGTLSGEVEIQSLRDVMTNAGAGKSMQRIDVTCRSPRNFSGKKDGVRLPDPFVLQVRLVASILDRNHPFIEIFLEPRLVLENKIPVRLTLRTPMPHTFNSKTRLETRGAGDSRGHDIYHELAQGDLVEVYTPGPSIALSIRCADPPVAGRMTDWMEGGWVDIPLVREFGLPEPLRCVFPFAQRNFIDPPNLSGVNGTEFFIVESGDDLSKLLLREEFLAAGKTPPSYDEETVELVEPKALTRKILFTVCNYAVDHTGGVLFEMANDEIGNGRRNSAATEASIRRSLSVGSNFPPPFSAYSSGHRRITLLPHEKALLRLLHLTMEGDEGVRRSKPFFLDDVSTSEGGVDSTPIRWQDNSESGYYAYRKLVDTYQFEVHIIPDFILFNGSKEHRVLVKQQDGPGDVLEPGRTMPIKSIPKLGLIISLEFIDLEARTASMRVDLLGLRVAIVKSHDGSPLGSVAVQTVIGNKDSRLVVKLGEVKFGAAVESDQRLKRDSHGMLDNDVLRFRVRWSELQVTLNEARTVDSDKGNDAFGDSGLDHFIECLPSPSEKKSPRQKTWIEAKREQSQEQKEIERQTQLPVCTIVFQRFTVDWQRIFKDGPATASSRDVLSSPERSQFSAIVHNVKILDETVGSEFPVVFNSSSSTSFFDLCVRCRGPLGAELVKVDLLDLNLAHAQGKSEKIVVQTTEEFIWKAIDVVNRIIVSTAELAGIDLKLEWDEEDGGYIVSMNELSKSSVGFDAEASYTPPQSETLYDINKARVSPFEMMISFRRRPQSSRYKHLQDVRGAKLMNYFTRRMKFKIDRAELKFSCYEASNIKGPPDRLIELLMAVYSSRMKYKVVSMLTAVSFEDWRNLAARDAGGDNFVDGDLLRVTGNLAGNTAGYVATKVGRGLGSGVIRVTSALGNEIEEATDKVGARAVGAGVNSVVSGLGGGVGNTIKGVGVGTGKVLQGAGKGVGQIFGGVTGGATLIAKGIGKGVTEGDGKALVSGFSQGVASVGNGLGNGFESAVMGAADGVVTCGEGLASGVRSIGSGFAHAFTGGKKKLRHHPSQGSSR